MAAQKMLCLGTAAAVAAACSVAEALA